MSSSSVTLPSPAATTAEERDGPDARLAIAIVYIALTRHALHREPFDAASTRQRPGLVFSQPVVLAAAYSGVTGTPHRSPLGSCVRSRPFATPGSCVSLPPVSLLTWRGSDAFPPHTYVV